MIITNAMGNGVVYSLELPPHTLQETDYKFLIDKTGINCHLPYIQCYGDSMTYNYAQHFPIEGWFIDGRHEHAYVLRESKEAIRSGAHIIIWHDTNIPQVFQAVKDAFKGNEDYTVVRVEDTRVTYAVANQKVR